MSAVLRLLRILTLGLALAPWVRAAAPAGEPVKIGFFMSLTGRDASFGEAASRGARLAIDDLNAAGGILGRPVELVVEDNRSLPGESATAVKKLLGRDKVVALVGECASSRTLEAAPLAQAAGVPLVTPASTNPRVTAVGDCVFRVCFADPFQGAVLATYAWKNLGLRRAALLVDSTASYSVGLADVFAKTFTGLGGEIVASQKYAGGDKDFRAQLTAIRATRAEAIFLPGYYVEAGLAARQARELGLTATLLGGDGFEAPQLLEIGGEALEGAVYSTHYSAESADPTSRRFVAAYTARHGSAPVGLAALTYDAVGLIADAAGRAGSVERVALKNALAATRDFAGVTGRTGFDENRDAQKAAAMIAVRGGKCVFVESVRP
jgi:branched-chain amino acid transport system substrate-binding protein